MLEYAKKHEDQLKQLYFDIAYDSFYIFGQASVYRGEFKLPEDTWSANHFVSVCDGKVIGSVGYQIRRSENSVDGLYIIHFGNDTASNKERFVFGKDILTALKDIFEKFGFNKLGFTVVIGNKIEKTYDRLIKRYNGRIVGIKKQEVRLLDGKLYDLKEYEILSEEYFKGKEKSSGE